LPQPPGHYPCGAHSLVCKERHCHTAVCGGDVLLCCAQAEVVEARSAARDARRKLAATQQRLELMVGRSMLQGGPKGGAPASAPASPAQQQQQRPPRQGDSAAS
jgi:hypothetical protein